MQKVMKHPFTKPHGRINQGGDLPIEISEPGWFADPNHWAKPVALVMFDLVKIEKEMTKLDALQIKENILPSISNKTEKEGIDSLMENKFLSNWTFI